MINRNARSPWTGMTVQFHRNTHHDRLINSTVYWVTISYALRQFAAPRRQLVHLGYPKNSGAVVNPKEIAARVQRDWKTADAHGMVLFRDERMRPSGLHVCS